jgi:hypothetical protein
MSGIIAYFRSKSKKKTPSPPKIESKQKTPSPPKTMKKTHSMTSILKKTSPNLTKKHSNNKKTDSPSVIKWGNNNIKEFINQPTKSNIKDAGLINECPTERPKPKDLPCKIKGVIIRNKKDYMAYILPKLRHCNDGYGSMKFPCNQYGEFIKDESAYVKYLNEKHEADAIMQQQKDETKTFTTMNRGRPVKQVLNSLNKTNV